MIIWQVRVLWGFRVLTEKLSACNNPRLCSTRCHKNGNHLCLCFCNSLDNLDIYNHTVRNENIWHYCGVLGEIPKILKYKNLEFVIGFVFVAASQDKSRIIAQTNFSVRTLNPHSNKVQVF